MCAKASGLSERSCGETSRGSTASACDAFSERWDCRPARKQRRKLRTVRLRALAPAHDFLHHLLGDGQSLKLLTVVDEWTREYLAIEGPSSLEATPSDRGVQGIVRALLRADGSTH